MCVAVVPKACNDFGNSERLSLEWTYRVNDIEVIVCYEKHKLNFKVTTLISCIFSMVQCYISIFGK
jgi:hypothetical protein